MMASCGGSGCAGVRKGAQGWLFLATRSLGATVLVLGGLCATCGACVQGQAGGAVPRHT